MGIFKAYDIRGKFPGDFDLDTVKRIGYGLATVLSGPRVGVGYDMRPDSPDIKEALSAGLRAGGKTIVDIGLCSTPQVSFAVGQYQLDGGVMITASHNPAGYNGFKTCEAGPIPLSGDYKLGDIQAFVEGSDPVPEDPGGEDEKLSIRTDYKKHILSFCPNLKPLKVVVDAANAMGGKVYPEVFDESTGVSTEPLYFELDGNFPNHEANPLKLSTLADLQAKVKETGADLGVAFDGDADRAAFVDEKGALVPCDLVTALFTKIMLDRSPGGPILYDLRSSRAVAEEIERLGGKPVRTRVGHSLIKAKLRETGALFGGELSGHYYFKDHFNSDSAMVAAALMFELLSTADKPLSELVAPFRKYSCSGEINFEVADKEAMMKNMQEIFSGAEIDHLDGVTIAYKDWWCNVRPSNTEPLLRLNLEANTPELMKEKLAGVIDILGEPAEGH